MKKYRDEIAEVCHEIVKDGYRSGKVTDAEMKEFEADCLVKEPKTSYATEKSPKTEYAAASN
jgi:DNA-binding transcriptional regulator YiaG